MFLDLTSTNQINIPTAIRNHPQLRLRMDAEEASAITATPYRVIAVADDLKVLRSYWYEH
jgi:hypothetical protein